MPGITQGSGGTIELSTNGQRLGGSFSHQETGSYCGCEHLQRISTSPEFETLHESYTSALNAIANKQGVVTQTGSRKGVDGGFKQTSLTSHYICLDCSAAFPVLELGKHTKTTGHIFALETRTAALFCKECDDIVYDVSGLFPVALAPKGRGSLIGQSSLKEERNASLADDKFLRQHIVPSPCQANGLRGLFNMGNTCFMSVILQSIVNNPLVRNYYLADGHNTTECTAENCLACSLDEVFTDTYSGDKNEGFSPVSLLTRSWISNTALAGYRQQDAHEYFLFLVNALHIANGGTADDSLPCSCVIHEIFYGKLQNEVTCGRCRNVTTKEDVIVDLSLDIQSQAKRQQGLSGAGGKKAAAAAAAAAGAGGGKVTMQGCLDNFTRPEKLQAHEYSCLQCSSPQREVSKQLRIKKLPQVMCIQFKRFETFSATSAKIEVEVKFPLEVDMGPYMSPSGPLVMDKKSKQAPPPRAVSQLYDLFCVIVHIGSINSGHYVCYARNAHQWFLFDDSKVTIVSEVEVLAANPYLLFYMVRGVQ